MCLAWGAARRRGTASYETRRRQEQSIYDEFFIKGDLINHCYYRVEITQIYHHGKAKQHRYEIEKRALLGKLDAGTGTSAPRIWGKILALSILAL